MKFMRSDRTNYRFVGWIPALVIALSALSAPAQLAIEDLGGLPASSIARLVSGDGVVVIGESASDSQSQQGRFFRWTSASGAVPIAFDLGSTATNIALLRVSFDGSAIVGNAETEAGPRAFRWTAPNETTLLEPIPGDTNSVAFNASSDATVVVGASRRWDQAGQTMILRLVRWTAGSAIAQEMGIPPGEVVLGLSQKGVRISGDGSVVVVQIALSGSSGVTGGGNDLCADAIPIQFGDTPFSTFGAQTDGNNPTDPSCSPFAATFYRDIWFTYYAQATESITLSTCNQTDFDTRLEVLSECGGELLACNDDVVGCDYFSSRLTFQAVLGETYLVRLGGYASQPGTGVLTLSSESGTSPVHLFRWTESKGAPEWMDLGVPSDLLANATWLDDFQLDDSGSVVVANRDGLTAAGPTRRASLWILGDGWDFVSDTQRDCHAHDMNGDGSVIVGTFSGSRVFRSSPEFPFEDLGLPPSALPDSIVNCVVSDEGGALVGTVRSSSSFDSTSGFHWSISTGMRDLGHLPGDINCKVEGTSRDCSVVVGTSSGLGGADPSAFRWTIAGMVELVGLPDHSEPSGISDDGSIIIGMGVSSNRPYRWSLSNGMIELRPLAGDSIAAINTSESTGGERRLSRNGSVVVGESRGGGFTRACLWTNADPIDLGILPGFVGHSTSAGVSGDGMVVVGSCEDFDGNSISRHNAFRWSQGVMSDLGVLDGFTMSKARTVNIDGSVVVGESFLDQSQSSLTEAFRWTSAGMVGLGVLDGFTKSFASDVSDDGSIVVGACGDVSARAFRWSGGLMSNLGVLDGFTDSMARGVSRDGVVIAGECWGFDSKQGQQISSVFRWTSGQGMVGLAPMERITNMTGNGSVICGSRRGGGGEFDRVACFWTAQLGVIDLEAYLTGLGLNLGGWILKEAGISADGMVITGKFDDSTRFSSTFRVSGLTLGGQSIPAMPTNVSATDGAFTDHIAIAWDIVADATSYQIFRSDSLEAIATVASVTSFDDLTALPGILYTYALVATNSAGMSERSVGETGYRNLLPPTSVVSIGGLTDRVRISWVGSEGAISYVIFRNGAPLAPGTATASPYDDLTAAIGVSYSYSVKATGAVGASELSASVIGWRAPAAPTNVIASDGTSTTSVLIGWSAVTGATGYKIYRGGAPNQIGAVGVATTFTDVSALAGISYVYSVKASTAAGLSAESASDMGFRNLSAPTGVAASDGTFTDRVEVTWNSVVGAVGFEILRSDSASPLAVLSAVTSFADTTAIPGTVFTYKVRAVGMIGTSALSAGNSGYRAIAPPVDVAASDGAFTDRVAVTWSPSFGAIGYKIFRDGLTTAIGSVGVVTSFSDTSAVAGNSYTYTVKVVVPTGMSTASLGDPGWRNVAAPTGVFATDGTFTDRVVVTWNPSAGATGYGVFRSGSTTPIGTVSNLVQTFTDFDAIAGTPYPYTVNAIIATGVSATSVANSGYCNVSPPSDVIASDGTSTSHVTVTWSGSIGATSYSIFRNGSIAPIAVVPASTTFNDNSAIPGTPYTYSVKSHGIVGVSVVSLADTGYRKLKAPVELSASDGTFTGKISVNWSTSFAATGYKIYRNRGATEIGTVGVETTFHDLTAVPGTLYSYAVVAVGGVGVSDLSVEESGFRNLSPPTAVAASNGSFSDRVELTWVGSIGATGYSIFKDSSSLAIATIGVVTTFSDFSALSGSAAVYRVRAIGAVGLSLPSAGNLGYANHPAPIDLVATDTDPVKVRVTWNASPTGKTALELVGFELWRSLAEESPTLVGVTDALTFIFDDFSIPSGVTATYSVRMKYVLAGVMLETTVATLMSLPDTGIRPPGFAGGDGKGDEGGVAGGGSESNGTRGESDVSDASGMDNVPDSDGSSGESLSDSLSAKIPAEVVDDIDEKFGPCEIVSHELARQIQSHLNRLSRGGLTDSEAESLEVLIERLTSLFEPRLGAEPAVCAQERGDVTVDGTIDDKDLSAFLEAWISSDQFVGDLNRDGQITADDMAIVIAGIEETRSPTQPKRQPK